MAKFESVITSLSLVVPKGTMLAILVILQSDYQTTRIRGVIKHESVQATRPIDQACLFHLFFHSVFAPPDSSSPAVCLPRLNYSVKRELCEVCLKPSKKKKKLQSLDVNNTSLGLPSKSLHARANEISSLLYTLFNLSSELATFPEK